MSSTINILRERYIFRSMSQGGQKLEVWIKHLERQANYCDFINIEEQIRDQIIEKTSSGELRKRALHSEMSLTEIINLAKIIEAVCYHCGSTDHKVDERCPARNMVCRICNVIGHIEKCCPEKNNSRKRTSEVLRVSPTSSTATAAVCKEENKCKRIALEQVLERERKRLQEELARNAEKRSSASAIRALNTPAPTANPNRFTANPMENSVRIIVSGVLFKALISDKHSVNVISYNLMKEMKIRFHTHERKEFIINGVRYTGVVDIRVERVDKVCSMMDFYITDDSRVGCIITTYNAKKLKLTSTP